MYSQGCDSQETQCVYSILCKYALCKSTQRQGEGIGPPGGPRTLGSEAYKYAAELRLPGLEDLQEPRVLLYRLRGQLPVALPKLIQELSEFWYACID